MPSRSGLIQEKRFDLKKYNIGGQAVIEGVMMKGPDKYAIAVRKPDNDIEVQVNNYKSFGDRHKICRVPIIRGVVNFVESLFIGVKTLMYSADFYEEDEPEEKKVKAQDDKRDKDKESSDTGYMIFTVVISLVIAIGLFMLLPAYLVTFLGKYIESNIILNLIEGILRLLIFIIYVVCISMMKDIKRTFMYHGAEHKTINCLEAGEELTPENVKKHTRYHKRCGTSFLFYVVIISIIVFIFVNTDTVWLRLISRLLLVPVIAGLSYEFIRFAGRSDSKLSYILSVPGMWVQKLTTKEPDLDMIEVAIKSVEGVIDWHEYIECVRNNSFEK